MGLAEGDIDGTISALENMEAQTDASILTMVSDLEGMLATLEATRAEILAIPTAELTADNTQALSVINATIAVVQALLAGIKPCVIGIILATGLHLMVCNILPDTGLDAKATFLTAFLTLVLVISRKVTKKGIQPISLIAISAVLGILLYGA
jgi:hypothetical protein